MRIRLVLFHGALLKNGKYSWLHGNIMTIGDIINNSQARYEAEKEAIAIHAPFESY